MFISFIYSVTVLIQNHVIERLWVEINKRVNYPIKKILLDMQNEHIIKTDQGNTVHCFCVSWFALRVVCVGTTLAVRSWNDHPIPGVFPLIAYGINFDNSLP